MMTDQELTQLIQNISVTTFNRPFSHQANFNRRLKTTGGRYHLQDHHIDINPLMVAQGQAVLEGIIKHELCHYHLHLLHRGHRHRDHGFKRLLQQVGGARFAPPVTAKKAPQKRLAYQCTKCGQLYQRQRHINTARYVCRRCHGHLKLVKEI